MIAVASGDLKDLSAFAADGHVPANFQGHQDAWLLVHEVRRQTDGEHQASRADQLSVVVRWKSAAAACLADELMAPLACEEAALAADCPQVFVSSQPGGAVGRWLSVAAANVGDQGLGWVASAGRLVSALAAVVDMTWGEIARGPLAVVFHDLRLNFPGNIVCQQCAAAVVDWPLEFPVADGLPPAFAVVGLSSVGDADSQQPAVVDGDLFAESAVVDLSAVPVAVGQLKVPAAVEPLAALTSSAVGFQPAFGGTGLPTAHVVVGLPTAHVVVGLPTAFAVVGLSAAHVVAGLPTAHVVAGLPTAFAVAGLPAAYVVVGLLTAFAVAGLPTAHVVAGLPTAFAVVGLPATYVVVGLLTAFAVTGLPDAFVVAGLPNAFVVAGLLNAFVVAGLLNALAVAGQLAAFGVAAWLVASAVVG